MYVHMFICIYNMLETWEYQEYKMERNICIISLQTKKKQKMNLKNKHQI